MNCGSCCLNVQRQHSDLLAHPCQRQTGSNERDIGNDTMNVMYVTDKKPDPRRCDRSLVTINDDICAIAKGYERMLEMKLLRNGGKLCNRSVSAYIIQELFVGGFIRVPCVFNHITKKPDLKKRNRVFTRNT